MVGKLYTQGDRAPRRRLHHLLHGHQLGSIGSQILCPIFANWFGWWAGFGLVVVGMLIGYTLIQFDGGRLAGYGEPPEERDRIAHLLIYALSISLRRRSSG